MSRRPLHLATALGLALLSLLPLAAAQPDPRAAELLEAFDRATFEGAERRLPRTLVGNLYMRVRTGHGPSTALTAMAFDYQGERIYSRTCVDGELGMELVYRDGKLLSLDLLSGEIAEAPAEADAVRAMLRSAFQDPATWLRLGYDTARYDGPADYGLVAGEQVTMQIRLPGQPPRQIAMLFDLEGNLVGQVMDAPEGRVVAVVDGLMRVEHRLMPRGMTMHLLLEDGTEKVSTMRFWRMRADVELEDSLFVLEPRPRPDSSRADRRREIMDRVTEVYTRLAEEMDMPVEEQEALFAEAEALMAELETTPLPSFRGPACPGPL